MVAGSQLVAQVATFGRNVVFARLLSPTDIGAAAAVLLVLTLMEMGTDCVAEEVLITDDGDLDLLQATVHGMRVVRSLTLAVVGAIVAAGAAWLHAPFAEVLTWPVAAAAVLLLAVRAVANADVERQVRAGRYGSYVTLQAVPQLAALGAAFPLAAWLGGPGAVLTGALVQSGVYVALSHVCAERGYRVAWHGPTARRVCGFGVPVLLNGLLLFGLMHGDRVLVGAMFGATALGLYTVASGLTLVPTLVAARVNAALLLPSMSRAREGGPEAMDGAVRRAFAVNTAGAGAMAFGWALAGDAAVHLIYGQRYAEAGYLVPLLALLQGVFVLRDLHGVTAMSHGDSRHPLAGNAVRVVGLGLMVPAAWAGSGPGAAVVAALAAELAAYVVSGVLLGRRHGVPAGVWAWPVAAVAGAWGAGLGGAWVCGWAGVPTLAAAAVLAVSGVTVWWCLRGRGATTRHRVSDSVNVDAHRPDDTSDLGDRTPSGWRAGAAT